jgi:hypothetical protein
MAMLRITRPIPRALSSCGSGGNPKKSVHLPFGEQLHEPGRGAGDPVDVLVRIEPDLRRHRHEQEVSARAPPIDAELSPLEVTEGPDRLVREQLVTTRMHAR